MQWNNHFRLRDQHSFLSPSSHQWLRYDPEKLTKIFLNKKLAAIGTERHAFAAKAIELGIKLYQDPKAPDTLSMYVNDSIDEKMEPEVILCYNEFAFGTADAIYFDESSGKLKIFDLKTGSMPVVKTDDQGLYILEQCEIYAALFCLEYRVDPATLDMDLRIYQNNEMFQEIPKVDRIYEIMNLIIRDCDILRTLKGV